MINIGASGGGGSGVAPTRLTTAQAARRLGVKPATVYAYVSRGLLHRQRSASGSTFDAQEVERLARSSRQAAAGGRGGRDMTFVTELTLIDDGRLRYRGLDAVDLSRTRTFEEVAGWLWNGTWPDAARDAGLPLWEPPETARTLLGQLQGTLASDVLPIERLSVGVAGAATVDRLRHDLRPEAVRRLAPSLVGVLVECLPLVGEKPGPGAEGNAGPNGVAARLWPRLSRLPATSARLDVLDAALVLIADHELAASTLAARVAAAFRADPYAVVATGLGPASGSYHSGASTEVERLLADAATSGVQDAIGGRIISAGFVPGMGMRLYPDGDPRGAELLRRVDEVAGDESRRAVIKEVAAVARERDFGEPNVDYGLASISFLAEMIPGAAQAITAVGRSAGWLAHAIEEYGRTGTFRMRAAYVGPR